MKSKLTQGRYRAPKRSACGLCKPQQRGRYFFFPVVHCWPLNAICLVTTQFLGIPGIAKEMALSSAARVLACSAVSSTSGGRTVRHAGSFA